MGYDADWQVLLVRSSGVWNLGVWEVEMWQDDSGKESVKMK
jgi:hypothetical protein